MAQTARDTVTRAMRLLGVIPSGAVPTAVEAADGLVTLNSMMHGWKGAGVDIGHRDLSLNDNIDLPDEHLRGCTALLACEMSSEYQVPIPQPVALVASAGWSALEATYTALNDPTKDQVAEIGLRRLGANRRLTGYYRG